MKNSGEFAGIASRSMITASRCSWRCSCWRNARISSSCTAIRCSKLKDSKFMVGVSRLLRRSRVNAFPSGEGKIPQNFAISFSQAALHRDIAAVLGHRAL